MSTNNPNDKSSFSKKLIERLKNGKKKPSSFVEPKNTSKPPLAPQPPIKKQNYSLDIKPPQTPQTNNPNVDSGAAEDMAEDNSGKNVNNIIQEEPQDQGSSSSSLNETERSPLEKASQKPEAAPEFQQTVKTPPPGGKAINAMKRLIRRGKDNAGQEDSENSDASAENTKSGAQQGIDQARKTATEAVKKAVSQAVKKMAARFMASLAANPYTWLIVGSIVLSIILFVIGLSYYSGLGNSKKPNAMTGRSPTIQVEPKKDWGIIAQVLKMSGEKLITEASLNKTLDDTNVELVKLREEVKTLPNAAEINKKIDAVLNDLSILKTTKTQGNAEKFLASLQGLLNMFENNIPKYPKLDASGNIVKPTGKPAAIDSPTFNNTLHGGSAQHIEPIKGHGTFTASNDGTCDAVDFGTPRGADVKPIFGGKVISVKNDRKGGVGGGKTVLVEDGDYRILYAHLVKTVDVGTVVTINDTLGVTKLTHIHIEAMYKNMCVVTTSSDVVAHNKKSSENTDWGKYMWAHMVEIFQIQ